MTRRDMRTHATAFAMFLYAWACAEHDPATAIIMSAAALAIEGTVNA